MSDEAPLRRPEAPGRAESAARELDDPGSWRLTAAGAVAGIAMGGFLVSILAHLHTRHGILVRAHEPVAALLAALGVFCFGARRGARDGLVAMGAALVSMLLGEVFWELAHTLRDDWGRIPALLLKAFGWRSRPTPGFTCDAWPKLVRYAFGLYIGWYLGSAAQGPKESRHE